MASSTARRPPCPGPSSSRPTPTAAAPPEPALRGRARGPAAVHRHLRRHALARLAEAPRPRRRHLRHRLRAEPHPRRIRPPARRAARLPARHQLAHHGPGAEPARPRRRPRARSPTRWSVPVAETLTLAEQIDAQIRATGPMSLVDLYGPLPQPSAPRLLRRRPPDRRRGRLHHRARDQPDVRRADRLLHRQSLAADGRAQELHPARARPRPRHADGRTRCAPPARPTASKRPAPPALRAATLF